jgi:hypothetical protein
VMALLLIIGAAADVEVPPRSPASCTEPLNDVVASGEPAPVGPCGISKSIVYDGGPPVIVTVAGSPNATVSTVPTSSSKFSA